MSKYGTPERPRIKAPSAKRDSLARFPRCARDLTVDAQRELKTLLGMLEIANKAVREFNRGGCMVSGGVDFSRANDLVNELCEELGLGEE